MPKDDDFDRSVFVNCPFDEDYDHILQAVLFCLVRFGLKPRIATERSDAGESRINKILGLIQSSRYSIHDLCRCQARDEGEYYRLNMPFELGLDFGCRRYGGGRLATKVILVLEEQRYRYQAAISDLAGSDIEAHHGDYQLAVRKVRNWLAGMPDFEAIGAARVLADYGERPICARHKLGLRLQHRVESLEHLRIRHCRKRRTEPQVDTPDGRIGVLAFLGSTSGRSRLRREDTFY